MFKGIIDLEFLLTPWGKSNTYETYSYVEIGHSSYYVFGIRVAKIQQTKPWSE